MSANAWVAALLRATFEGGALLLLIWIVTRLWPRMPAAARCGLWWVGTLRMLVGLVRVPTIPIAWKPAAAAWVPDVRTPAIQLGNAMAGVVVPPPAVSVPARAPLEVIPVVFVALWAVGVIVGVVILTRHLLALRRTWRAARPFEDPRVAAWQTEWAVAIGRGHVPEVRASADTEVPVAFGALRPGLLLPADSTRLSDDALRMVLAHEMSHVRRRDTLLGWVPATAQLVFWFFPLVRFAVREYLAAREQVSDADALRATGVAPHDYGALLLDYGVGRMFEAPGVASCGSRGARDLKRRLDMLSRTLRVPTSHRAGAAFITIAVVALAFAPIRFVAAHESKDPGSREQKTKSELDRKRQLEKKRAYDKLSDEAQFNSDDHEKAQRDYERLVEKSAYQRAYDKGDKHKRSPIAYMIKIEGQKGTRGAVDEMDMESARRLDSEDKTAVYFRLGDEMWLTTDERTIESVLRAVEQEDRLDEKSRVSEGRREAYEEQRAKLEMQRAEIEMRKSDVEARKQELIERSEQSRRSKEVLEEKAAIESEMQLLWEEQEMLNRAQQRLSQGMRSTYTRDKISYAERDEIHQRVLAEVADIARRAIEDGRAERFEP